MKKIGLIIILLSISFSFAQDINTNRIQIIKTRLDSLSNSNSGLNENVKTEINVSTSTLANFLIAVSNIHKVNINVAPELSQINIVNNFTNVTVADLLVFLCKEYNLTIDFTGNILSVKAYQPQIEKPAEHIIPIRYYPSNNTISIDAKGDKLYKVFKRIMDETGKNLVFTSGLEDILLTFYVKEAPFDSAMEQLAFANNLFLERSKDGYYIFENNAQALETTSGNNQPAVMQRPSRRRSSNFFFRITDLEQQLLEVDFVNTLIADIINDIGNELNIDIFTATPLDEAGTATFKAKSITFDALLTKLFETQTPNTQTNTNPRNINQNQPMPSNNTAGSKRFTFKKEGDIYFFGTEQQLSVREVAIVHLQHRSVELLSDPQSGGMSSRSAGRTVNPGFNNSSINNRNLGQTDNNFNTNRRQLNTSQTGSFNSYSNQAEALVNILPDEVKKDLDIKVDYELNSFYVNGPSAKIERFRTFINKIDKPVPVVLIEVMILNVSVTSTLEAGVTWGIGTEPATTQGSIYPETDLTLGANTINKIIGNFNGFGALNIGSVVPNFFATIKAMESNGDLEVRSTPRLSTLNGHRAYFSNGQTSYYAITDQAVIGSNNPVTTTAVNYQPIDAELGLTIKPMVSGDGQVTLDISVIQSSFGARIAEDAPPDINSREFTSLIRMKDQDIVVLGGLEENSKNDSGSGVPFLARIPVIKWLFSKRVREDRKSKLTVLIKPTVIY